MREAAEKNARQWLYGPFPLVADFPIYHTVTYVYKLEGKPMFVARSPHVKVSLPDRVEIIATPLANDYPPIIPNPKSESTTQ